MSDNWTIVGQFGRPHGIKGYITVHSFTEPAENILTYAPWYISVSGQWQPLPLLDVIEHHKAIIALIDGYADRTLVDALKHVKIAVKSDQFPTLPAGEFYWSQLVGMQVIDQHEKLLGKITEILPTGSSDVLVIMGEKRYLIPYRPDEYILSVDTQANIMKVNWEDDD